MPGTKGFVGGTDETTTTGLVHLGAREYDPAIGRFISVDLILDVADSQQMNGYNYANNSPITPSDPDGLRPIGPTDSPRADAFSRGEMKGYAGVGGTRIKLIAPFGTNWGASCPTGIAPAPEEKAG